MKLKEILVKFLNLLIKWVKWDYFYYSAILLFSLWFFVKIAVDVITKDEITYYDRIIVDFINTIASEYSTSFAVFITHFGSIYLFLLFLVAVIAFLASRLFKEAAFISATLLGGYFLTYSLKDLFDRARPVVGTPIIQETGYSFPSGHATLSMCFYGALIYLVFIQIKNVWIKSFLIGLLGLLILSVGLSRIYLGVHYPSDVLAGFSLGIFWVSLCSIFYKKSKKPV